MNNFEHFFSDITRKETASISFSFKDFEIAIHTEAKYFKPFMPFEGFVSAKLPDGSPAVGKEINVQLVGDDFRKSPNETIMIQRNFTTDAAVSVAVKLVLFVCPCLLTALE